MVIQNWNALSSVQFPELALFIKNLINYRSNYNILKFLVHFWGAIDSPIQLVDRHDQLFGCWFRGAS